MLQNRIPIIRAIAGKLRYEEPVDIYGLAAKLQLEFPDTPRQILIDIVSEEVVKAHANAVWLKRDE